MIEPSPNRIRLMHGDCLVRMAEIADASVDLILCDLPYGTTANKWDSVIDLPTLWTEYLRIISTSGAIVLTAQTPFDKVLGASNLKMLRYEWVWEKTLATGHLNAKRAPLKAHENILVFYKKPPIYRPIKTTGHPRKTSTKRGDTSTNYGEQLFDSVSYDSTERYPRSVLHGPSDTRLSNLHPTQKPVWLMEYLIRTYTDEGQLVLDNTMGSGTTGVAAVNSNRKFIGIERDREYFKIAKARIKAAVIEVSRSKPRSVFSKARK